MQLITHYCFSHPHRQPLRIHCSVLLIVCKLAGLDVVDAVRRLGAFSHAFAYSLAGQLFVERADAVLEAKNLNTLSLGGAAAAIRTHGPGLAVAARTRTASFLTGRLRMLAQVGATLHSISSLVP